MIHEFGDFTLNQTFQTGLAHTKVTQIAQRETPHFVPVVSFTEQDSYKTNNELRYPFRIFVVTFFILRADVEDRREWTSGQCIFFERLADGVQWRQNYNSFIIKLRARQ